MHWIAHALSEGRTALSEFESKQLLASYSIPVTREFLVTDRVSLNEAAREIGFPLALKGCSAEISHKTEQGLVRLDVRDERELQSAFEDLTTRMHPAAPAVLVQEMVKGERELLVGLTHDPQFGPCVMFGLGGVFTEVLEDVTFRMAPLTRNDALRMMRDIRAHKILGPIRNMEPVDLDAMAEVIINVGRLGLEHPQVKEIDINPLKIRAGKPVAVDALVVLG
ncbi:MAG: acetate--CoA ligase family protein [Thermodesulfobacteriota bacterium]